MKEQYDLAIIGAGPGGYVAAIRAAHKNLAVLLIEKDEVGGTCLNRGCIPTKTLIHSADLYRELGHASEIGLVVDDPGYDLDKMYARKNAVVDQLRGGIEQLVKANKIDLIHGTGQVTASGRVRIVTGDGETAVQAEHIIVATGARPAKPPVPGMDLPGVITSDELLAKPPLDCRRITIIGGGVIGVEFASVFGSLGIEVTLIEAMDRLLPTLDKEISQNLAMIFKRRGIRMLTGARVEKIEQSAAGLTCHYLVKDTAGAAESDLILVATGRRANAETVFAEGCNIELDRGSIPVNGQFETCIPKVYAIGDVIKNGIQLAHVASAQGLATVSHICGEESEIDLGSVPSCIYTDPEIAVVGLTAEQAEEQGVATVTGKYVMTGNGRSIIAMQDRGFIKVVAEAGTERILGAQLMCARATDLVSEFATAIVNRLTVRDLERVIRPHPTFCEGVTEAIESFHGMATHITPPKTR